jgi:type IV fimbrial biogenesis protein FimT
MRRSNSSAAPGRPRGWSLLEGLLAVALAASMTAVAWAQLSDWLNMRRLQAASADWAGVLMSARQWSFELQQPVRLELRSDSRGACLVAHTGQRGDCSGCGAPAVCQPGVQLVARSLPLPSGVSASANISSQLWNPGTRSVSPAGTLRLHLSDGRTVHHVVNLAGRLRRCSPDGPTATWPAC